MVNISGGRNELKMKPGKIRSVRSSIGSVLQTELLVELEGVETTLSTRIGSKPKACLIEESP